ncbi:hypothetical protein ACFWU5_16660 [Nocardia sp. NPDC058640]|uniref:hypothetical protein n=1 Tax=Nocardia sp. NPDC058640 TaxID=3346571 RepID=UPI003646D690
MKPSAIGYLRSDVSGRTEEWDRAAIKALAARYGYTLVKFVTYSEHTDDPIQRLINVVRRYMAEAVFAPSLAHFSDEVPDRLVCIADVNLVAPECTYAQSYALPEASPPPMKEMT